MINKRFLEGFHRVKSSKLFAQQEQINLWSTIFVVNEPPYNLNFDVHRTQRWQRKKVSSIDHSY